MKGYACGAIIEHKYGFNLYLGTTEKAVQEQVYDYVKTYWEEEGMMEEPIERFSMMDAIEAYFEDNGQEWFCFFENIPILEEGEVEKEEEET
jgi:hypothetical protein